MEKKSEQKIEQKDFDKRVEDRKDVRLIDLEGLEDLEFVLGGSAACNKSN